MAVGTGGLHRLNSPQEGAVFVFLQLLRKNYDVRVVQMLTLARSSRIGEPVELLLGINSLRELNHLTGDGSSKAAPGVSLVDTVSR
jgi:hypothetical protein